MADNDIGLNISVSASADVASAKEAVDDLTKGVLKELKNGYIEIPAGIEADFKKNGGASKELRQAQKEFIDQWKKMSSEGFSSSDKELKNLIDTYKEYTRLLSRDKQRNTRQNRALQDSGIGSVLNEYNKQLKALNTANTKIKTPKVNTRKRSKSRPGDTIYDDEIQADIKKENNRRLKGLKSAEPKGYKTNSWIDPGRTNEHEAKASEVSSYPSRWAQQINRDQKEANKKTKAPKVEQNITEEDYQKRKKNDKIQGTNKNNFTPREKALGMSEVLLKQLPKILGEIEAGNPDVKTEDFFDTLHSIFELNQAVGEKTMKSVQSSLNLTLHKYFNSKGNIGGTNGEDKAARTYNDKVVVVLERIIG